jgi:hypothetical protein
VTRSAVERHDNGDNDDEIPHLMRFLLLQAGGNLSRRKLWFFICHCHKSNLLDVYVVARYCEGTCMYVTVTARTRFQLENIWTEGG